MNHWNNDPQAPWEQEPGFECTSCQEFIETWNDACIIDGHQFCDSCASDIMQLRFDGWIDPVKDKTKQLVKAVDDANYLKAWQQEFDKNGKVKHI